MLKVDFKLIENLKRERHSTLGFVELMIQRLEKLRSEKVQNKVKIEEIEEELSEIDLLIRGALKES